VRLTAASATPQSASAARLSASCAAPPAKCGRPAGEFRRVVDQRQGQLAAAFAEFRQDVVDRADERRAFADERVAAAAGRAVRPARHGAERPTEVAGEARGDHAAAVDVGLDHDHHADEAGDDPVALRERLPVRRPAEREFGEHAAVGLHLRAEPHRFRREGQVEPVADDRGGAPGGVQRAFVRRGVDAAGQAADDPPALPREVARERARQRSPSEVQCREPMMPTARSVGNCAPSA
jgi:hypothetical protein